MNNLDNIKELLDSYVDKYNRPDFINTDPISIPHSFKRKQDIEISGFLAATLAWGQRPVIISKSIELMGYMDFSPYEFVLNHSESELKPFLKFKHRTFNPTDVLYFIHFFRRVYLQYDSLEPLFVNAPESSSDNIGSGINHFRQVFVNDPDFPLRTGKHVASPDRKSACKRINMFLRWMVRKDDRGVDFGIWNGIKPSQLICPLDVHVDRIARKLSLLKRKQTDWQAAVELTENLKRLDPDDPVKYDFALFGMGVFEN